MVDWMETAALIDTLDLIISADTGVAHLAGALGKPVWMLNRYNSDWRWGLRSKTTPWYPSMRIFRQPRLGDWDTVLDQVVAELRRMID
jgi:ADP-heptose:LPS heptosyltransferase